MRATGLLGIAVITISFIGSVGGQSFDGAEFDARDISGQLAAGEFAAATRDARALPADQRAPALSRIALSQAGYGESSAAGRTVRSIDSPDVRRDTVDGIRAPGGASFADFTSLIDLIQTTVVPDTWDLLGGPSTMKEYAQGVYVDSHGTIKTCETSPSSDAMQNLKASILGDRETLAENRSVADNSDAWQSPAKLRCVSLRRLIDATSMCQMNGLSPSASMLHMAGLSDVRYLFLDKENSDIIMAGTVGGIENVDGVFRDRSTLRGTLRHDFLTTCLASMVSGTPFGCTIDPTTEGLQRSAAVAADVQADRLPIGKAADALADALAMQRVEVFGTPGDTAIGYLMVEADRHMKELALGIHPMPRGVINYLDATEAAIDRGAPDGLLLRLWFTASPRDVRADAERTIFEIAGSPVHLSGQNERAVASGARGNLTEDVRTEMFVAAFNKHFHDIRGKYPVYGSLEAIYQTAAVAELLRNFADTDELRSLIRQWSVGGSMSVPYGPTPRQVESIAVLHKIRHGRKIHHVLVASGGVAVNLANTVSTDIADYPSLRSMANVPDSRPAVIQNWWWDAR